MCPSVQTFLPLALQLWWMIVTRAIRVDDSVVSVRPHPHERRKKHSRGGGLVCVFANHLQRLFLIISRTLLFFSRMRIFSHGRGHAAIRCVRWRSPVCAASRVFARLANRGCIHSALYVCATYEAGVLCCVNMNELGSDYRVRCNVQCSRLLWMNASAPECA